MAKRTYQLWKIRMELKARRARKSSKNRTVNFLCTLAGIWAHSFKIWGGHRSKIEMREFGRTFLISWFSMYSFRPALFRLRSNIRSSELRLAPDAFGASDRPRSSRGSIRKNLNHYLMKIACMSRPGFEKVWLFDYNKNDSESVKGDTYFELGINYWEIRKNCDHSKVRLCKQN